MSELAETFTLVAKAVEPIVDTEPDSTAETPCSDWDYGHLLGHLVGGDDLFVAILGGADPSAARAQGASAAEHDVPTPKDYRRSSGRLAHLLATPEVLAGEYDLPVGRLAGPQIVILRSVEHLLHGWDLARSAGAPTTTLEPVAEALREPALQLLDAVGDRTLADRRPFGEPVEVADDASALDRFVAAFGRDPGWLPDPVAGYAALKERFAGYDDVELPDGTRRGYGADGMRVDNLVFACTHKGRLMIKLPEDEVNELIADGLGLPLAKPGQGPMREWVLVPFDGAAAGRAERAYAFLTS